MLEELDFEEFDIDEIEFDDILIDIEEIKAKAKLLMNSNSDNLELFRLAQSGDDEALVVIYEKYKPVLQYMYLKQKPYFNASLNINDIHECYESAYVSAINKYNPKYYNSFYACLYNIVNSRISTLKRKSKTREKVRIINGFDDNSFELKGDEKFIGIEGESSLCLLKSEKDAAKKAGYLNRLLEYLDERERKLFLGLLEGDTISAMAERRGVSFSTLSGEFCNAKKELVKFVSILDEVAGAYYIDKKPISQISKEFKMTRYRVGYHLQVYDYLHNGGAKPQKINPDRLIAEVILTDDEMKIYTLLEKYKSLRYVRLIEPKYDALTTKIIRQIKRAKDKMIAVAEGNENLVETTNNMAKANFNKMSSHEIKFYAQLYGHVIFGGAKPEMPQHIKNSLVKNNGEEGGVILWK